MKPKKAKPKVCHRKLPPHSWEAHPTANQGEANKQLIIAVITISAIIVLGVLLLFSDQIVGKAFFVPEAKFTAGIDDPGKIYENTPFSLLIKTNIDTKSTVAIEFKLNLPEGITCADLGNDLHIVDDLGWDGEGLVFDTAECISNQVVFKYATIDADKARNGAFTIAELKFQKGAPLGVYGLTFESFNIYDLAAPHTDLIVNGIEADIEVKGKDETGCVGGKSNQNPDAGENCKTCPADVICPADQHCSDTTFSCVPNKVCTKGTKSCSDENTVLICDLNEMGYTKIADCADNELCEDGACVEIAEPVCTAGEYFCFNLTQVARCDSDGMAFDLLTICTADQSCPAGAKACAPKTAAPVCTDTDPADTDLVGIIGLNYFEKGIASDGTTSAPDICKSDIILTEKFCKDNVITSQDVDCKSYAKNDYICKDDACVAKSTIPMKIELLGSTGLAVAEKSTLTLGGNYKVKVTVAPLEEDLGKHLLIAQVAYNNQSNTYIYESQGNLSVGEEESIELAHKIEEKGELKIEAFVWGSWPSTGTGNALLDKVEVKYEIK